MNVLLHCIYFPPEVGGLESHVYHLARGLVNRGHGVEVITSRSQSDLPAEEWMDGIHVLRTAMPTRTPLGWIAHAIGSIPQTVRSAHEVDIIHAQAFGSVLPCACARSRSRRPLVATFHTSHFLVRAIHPLWKPILSRLVRAPDYCLAASEEIADVAGRLAPTSTVEALTNGVDTELFRSTAPAFPEGRDRRIIIPRRLFPKNGVEFLVRAMPAILERAGDQGVEALIVGDGPEAPRLRALAEELGVAGSIRFLGARPNLEMPALLCSAALAVIPSLMEATSVAALEAMSCGLPVAASNVGGLPEIIDQTVGGLMKPGDPADIAQVVVELLAHRDRTEMGKRARERVVDRWSVDRLVTRHLEIYRSLLNPEDMVAE